MLLLFASLSSWLKWRGWKASQWAQQASTQNDRWWRQLIWHHMIKEHRNDQYHAQACVMGLAGVADSVTGLSCPFLQSCLYLLFFTILSLLLFLNNPVFTSLLFFTILSLPFLQSCPYLFLQPCLNLFTILSLPFLQSVFTSLFYNLIFTFFTILSTFFTILSLPTILSWPFLQSQFPTLPCLAGVADSVTGLSWPFLQSCLYLFF